MPPMTSTLYHPSLQIGTEVIQAQARVEDEKDEVPLLYSYQKMPTKITNMRKRIAAIRPPPMPPPDTPLEVWGRNLVVLETSE